MDARRDMLDGAYYSDDAAQFGGCILVGVVDTLSHIGRLWIYYTQAVYVEKRNKVD